MSLRRNFAYNLLGQAAPLLSALVTIPIYLRLIGPDRFGVLSIAWLLLGYFGLFDLGLGRATSFRIAALRDAAPQARADTFWAALIVNAAMGIVGAGVLLAAGGVLFGHVFRFTPGLKVEALAAMPWLAMSVPVATLTGVLTGALQARERFLWTNIVSIGSTLLFQLMPLAIAWRLGPGLPLVLGGAVAARMLALVLLAVMCRHELTRGLTVRLRRSEIKALLGYGAWVTATSICAPFLVMIDRFVIAAVLGAGSVTIYTVPYQLAQRIAIVPASLTNALFPRMAAASPQEQREQGREATLTLTGILTVPVLGAIFLLGPFLHVWLGEPLAAKSAPLGRALIVGFWINAFALVSFVKLQASGRPDLVTKALAIEIIPYLAALWWAMTAFGVIGCAMALAARFLLDYAVLGLMARSDPRVLPLLASQLVCLTTAALCAGRWTIADQGWWLSAVILAALCVGTSWRALPAHVRAHLGSRLAQPLLRRAQ